MKNTVYKLPAMGIIILCLTVVSTFGGIKSSVFPGVSDTVEAYADDRPGITLDAAGDIYRAEQEEKNNKNNETENIVNPGETADEGNAEDVKDYSEYWPAGPKINGDAAIVVDASTGVILYADNIFEKHFPASTTKIMTTLVALENSRLNETVTVSYEAEWYVSKTSSRMGLVEGEQLSMEEALYGVMLESANEGTYAVGEHVAGGSIARFIKMMNSKAEEVGCVNTHFANSHGLHDEEHFTCAYDLARIAMAAWQNEDFRKITGARSYEMPSTNKNPARLLVNHHKFINKEMSYDYIIGGKTGATTQAGYCLVSYGRKDGMTIISVVMHSDTWNDVYNDTKTLMNFVFDNYRSYKIEDVRLKGTKRFPSMFTEAEAFERNGEEFLRIAEDGNLVLPNTVSADETTGTVHLSAPEELKHGDNVVGTINYLLGNSIVSNAKILFYNSEMPITAEVFEESWPKFLIPVDVAFPSPTPIPEEGEKTEEQPVESKYGANRRPSTGNSSLESTTTDVPDSGENTSSDLSAGSSSENPHSGNTSTGNTLPEKEDNVSGVKAGEGAVSVPNNRTDLNTGSAVQNNDRTQTSESSEEDIRPLLLSVATFTVVTGLGFAILFRKPKRGKTTYYK